jgi:hypothetical protein
MFIKKVHISKILKLLKFLFLIIKIIIISGTPLVIIVRELTGIINLGGQWMSTKGCTSKGIGWGFHRTGILKNQNNFHRTSYLS